MPNVKKQMTAKGAWNHISKQKNRLREIAIQVQEFVRANNEMADLKKQVDAGDVFSQEYLSAAQKGRADIYAKLVEMNNKYFDEFEPKRKKTA